MLQSQLDDMVSNFTMGFHIFDYDPVLGRKMMKFSRPLMFCCDAVACSDAPKRLETRTIIAILRVMRKYWATPNPGSIPASRVWVVFEKQRFGRGNNFWFYIHLIIHNYSVYIQNLCLYMFHVCFWWRHQKYMLMEQLFAATMCGWLRNIHATMETLDSH